MFSYFSIWRKKGAEFNIYSRCKCNGVRLARVLARENVAVSDFFCGKNVYFN